MTITKITELPPAPVVTDTQAEFANKAAAFVSALDVFVTDANTLASDVDLALAGALVQFDSYQGEFDSGETYNQGQVVRSGTTFYISLVNSNNSTPPSSDWQALNIASSIEYDNNSSGLTSTDLQSAVDEISVSSNIGYDNSLSGLESENVQSAIDEVAASLATGYFYKTDRDSVAWTKTGNGTAETGQTIYVEVGGEVLEIASGTTIAMPTLTAGTDYAIWVAPDGTLEADDSFSVAPTAGGRRIGGFHYAPGGNASFSLNAGDGGTTPQINEFSFYDLKWRPSVADPRGLTLVGDGAFWCGIYHLAGDHLVGPPHRHGVNPARDGNPPDLIDGSGNYPDAQPMNIFESLWYHGFRTPRVEDFQLLAFGTNEAASRGSDPGTTGLPGGSTDAQFTSHWGVIQSTGVIALWSNDSILSTADETLPNPSRGNRFRVQRFAVLGGNWDVGSDSGSRNVFTFPATFSFATLGGRGICDHLIIN